VSQQGAEPQGGKSPFVWVVLAVVFIVLVLAFWAVWRQPILTVYREVRLGELWALSFVDGSVEPIRAWLEEHQGESLTGEQVELLAVDVGHRVRWIAAAFAICWVVFLFRLPQNSLYRRHTLETFLRVQVHNFPILMPIVRTDPTVRTREPGTVPARLGGTWEEALQPAEWLGYYQVPVLKGKVDAEIAAARMAEQLGKPWSGPGQLAPHALALFVALCIQGARKRDEARAFAGELAGCWWPKKGFRPSRAVLKKIKAVLSDPAMVNPALEIARQHHWTNVVFLRLILWARERAGNFASSQFVWLRPVDRTLWYVVNGAGRQPFWVEAAGVKAHFDAEMAHGYRALARARREIAEAGGATSPELIDRGADPEASLDFVASRIEEPAVSAAVEALQAWIVANNPRIPRSNQPAGK
jgi:intracellular multiplication protein IcmP